VVQLNEFFFGKRINIDLAHCLPSNRMLILYRKLAFRNKIASQRRLRVPQTSVLRLGSSLYYSWLLLLATSSQT
jgi:hypothetical protein